MKLRQTEGSMAEVTLANKGSWRALDKSHVPVEPFPLETPTVHIWQL